MPRSSGARLRGGARGRHRPSTGPPSTSRRQLGNPTTIFEATGLTFYDALSSVPAAIEDHGAILLTDGSTQDPETATYLAAHPADTRYAIGGPAAALGADPSAIGVYGADAYATSAAVATFFFPNANSYGVATGLSYTDALSGGVFMATGGRLGPILLVDPSVVPPVSALRWPPTWAPSRTGPRAM
jgi:hypothetical protein